jgi:hypothetical protein
MQINWAEGKSNAMKYYPSEKPRMDTIFGVINE